MGKSVKKPRMTPEQEAIVAAKYKTGQYSYRELGKLFNIGTTQVRGAIARDKESNGRETRRRCFCLNVGIRWIYSLSLTNCCRGSL